MDLHTAQQLNGRLWNGAKLAALLCFVVAGILLATSLILTPPPVGASRPAGSGAATAQQTQAPGH